MRRGLIIAGTIPVVVVSLLVLAELIADLVPLNRYRPLLERRLSDAVGLEVKVRGDLLLDVLPRPHFEVTDVVVQSAAGPEADPFAKLRTIDLTFGWRGLVLGPLRITTLSATDVELRIDADAPGLPDANQVKALEGQKGAGEAKFQIRAIRLRNFSVFYRGASGQVTSVRFDILALSTREWEEPLAVVARGELDGGSFDLRGVLGPAPELFKPTQPYPLSLAGRVLEAQVSVEGTTRIPLELSGLDLTLSATVRDLWTLAPPQSTPRPPLPASFKARLTNPGGRLALEDLSFSSPSAAPLRIELTGSVRDVVALEGVDLDLSVEAEDAGIVASLFEWPLHDIGPLRASAHIHDLEGTLGLEGELVAGSPELLEIRLKGSYDDLRQNREIDVDVRVRAANLRGIGTALHLETPLPSLGPLVASGKLRDTDGVLGIEAIDVELGGREDTWAEITGAIRALDPPAGIELAAEFGATSLHHLAAYARGELPDIGRIAGAATVSDSDGSIGVEQFRLQAGREGLFEVDLSGTFDDVRKIGELQVDARIKARDLGVIGAPFGLDLPALGPLEFVGRLSGDGQRVSSEGRLVVNQTRFDGEWSVSFPPGARPSVRARLHSPHIHLDDIGLAPEYAAELPRPDTPSPSDGIPLEQLRSFDADVVLSADRMTGRLGLDAQELEARIQIDDGQLVIRDLIASSEGGNVRASLEIDARTPEPQLDLQIEIAGVDLTQIMAQFQEQTESAGIFDLSTHLRSHGGSAHALRSNLNGEFELMVRDGVLTSQVARNFVKNFVGVAFPTFRAPEDAPVSCLRIGLDVAGGVASVEQLLLIGEKITVTGQGTIDIGGDRFRLLLTPKVKDPGLLSMAVSVSIRGPITSPTYSPVKRTIATSVATGLLSNALRPASRLARPFLAEASSEDPCAVPLSPVYAALIEPAEPTP